MEHIEPIISVHTRISDSYIYRRVFDGRLQWHVQPQPIEEQPSGTERALKVTANRTLCGIFVYRFTWIMTCSEYKAKWNIFRRDLWYILVVGSTCSKNHDLTLLTSSSGSPLTKNFVNILLQADGSSKTRQYTSRKIFPSRTLHSALKSWKFKISISGSE